MKYTLTALSIPIISLFIAGCQSKTDEVVSPNDGTRGVSLSGLEPNNVLFLTFDVVFTGRTFNGTSTTFSYTVSGPRRDLHFRLGWPVTECTQAPVSWTPVSGATGNNDCCINPGIEWHPALGSDPFVTYYFTYTFNGDIPVGIVPASVKSNSDLVVGEIAGPGSPEYLVSGNVFQDANTNATLDANETFITGVTINLRENGTVTSSTTSNASGYYEFSVPCGTYSVELDTTTLTGTDKTYFVATTALSHSVSVGPDSPGNSFGFDVNTTKLLSDLNAKTLPTTGLNAAFWKKEFQFAVSGRTSTYSPAQLLGFLAAIEELALETPFVFPVGDQARLDFVYQMLRKPLRTDFEAFERELITIELNYAAGKGIDLSTELVLIGWGETLYNAPGGSNPKGVVIQATTIQDATSVYRGINSNKSTGGGGTQ